MSAVEATPTARLTGRTDGRGAAAAAAEGAYFSCRDLHAYYGESYVVQGISLDIKKGEVLALLGRNGAGKTSTLRAIARADSPSLRRGEIFLAGKAIHPLRARRRNSASNWCRRTAASSAA